MTMEIVEAPSNPTARTWAMPPVLQAPEKALKVILVAGALMVAPSASATEARPKQTVDARLLAGAWTNSGVMASPSIEPSFAEAVLELRRRSGLTWELLASLFNVDRRSVHLWATGRPMSAPNAEKLSRILSAVRRAEGLTPSVTRAWLLSVDAAGLLPLDQLREGKFDDIVLPARRAVSPRPAPISDAVRNARAPRPPEELVAASHDRVHIEKV